jgi:hypothetical protein
MSNMQRWESDLRALTKTQWRRQRLRESMTRRMRAERGGSCAPLALWLAKLYAPRLKARCASGTTRDLVVRRLQAATVSGAGGRRGGSAGADAAAWGGRTQITNGHTGAAAQRANEILTAKRAREHFCRCATCV